MASQITSLTIVCSTVYSSADQRKHQSPASLAFVREIHRWPVNSPHKGPVTRKMFPFHDVNVERCLLINTAETLNKFINIYSVTIDVQKCRSKGDGKSPHPITVFYGACRRISYIAFFAKSCPFDLCIQDNISNYTTCISINPLSVIYPE